MRRTVPFECETEKLPTTRTPPNLDFCLGAFKIPDRFKIPVSAGSVIVENGINSNSSGKLPLLLIENVLVKEVLIGIGPKSRNCGSSE